jgi:hypothetical protein
MPAEIENQQQKQQEQPKIEDTESPLLSKVQVRPSPGQKAEAVNDKIIEMTLNFFDRNKLYLKSALDNEKVVGARQFSSLKAKIK